MDLLVATNKVHTGKYEFSLIEEDIIYIHYLHHSEIGIEEIVAGINFQEELGRYEDIYRIVHADPYVTITAEAREFFEHFGRPVIAEAFIMQSTYQKILFNFYESFRSHFHPIKAFDNIDEAKTWLRSFSE